MSDAPVTTFTKVILFTDTDGRAKFRDEAVALDQGSPQSMLSEVFASGGYQLNVSTAPHEVLRCVNNLSVTYIEAAPGRRPTRRPINHGCRLVRQSQA